MRLILHGSQARYHGEEVSQGEVQSLDKKKAPVPEKQFDQTDDSMNLEGLRSGMSNLKYFLAFCKLIYDTTPWAGTAINI
jgi:hypothetical protein